MLAPRRRQRGHRLRPRIRRPSRPLLPRRSRPRRGPRVTSRRIAHPVAATLALMLAAAPVAAQYTSFSTIATNPYFAGDINSCAIQVNNLTTIAGYQFAAYYDTS